MGTLYWEYTYELVLALDEHYPAVDLESLGIEELRRQVAALPDFADDPNLANEEMLNELLREWYEERNA
jgi:FeS assembly protein IscX